MIKYYCDICKQPVKIWYQLDSAPRRSPDMVGFPSDAIGMTNRSRIVCRDCGDKIEAFVVDLEREATANE